MMRRLFFLLVTVCSTTIFAQDTLKTIKGNVSDGRYPIVNVSISVLGKDTAVFSDDNGFYSLSAEVGDKISYKYQGLKTVIVKVEDVTRVLNITMVPDVEELDEVVVAASRRQSQKDLEEDYAINNRIIRTAYGYLNADKSAGQVRFLSEEEINPVGICILDLLRSRFPGVRVFGSCGLGTGNGFVVLRGGGNVTGAIPVIYDIDGQIFEDTPVWINIDNIKRLAILNNLANTAAYGNLGKGGVIVINTKGGSTARKGRTDFARLRNNYADGLELDNAAIARNAPEYEKEFKTSTSLASSKAIFDSNLNAYANSPYFIITAYTHFVAQHGVEDYADDILATYFKPFANNPVLLKALAYSYESQGRFKKAHEVYKEVFVLRPNYVQSYLDLANSYRNLKEFKQAASIYSRYDYLISEGFLEQDTLGFDPIMQREFNNLLTIENRGIVTNTKARKLYLAEEDFKGTRLVFEWNDGEAEFDLQFVNPENQYYKWKHNMTDNFETIALEKDFGYNIKEYLIDGALPGIWQVNINYLGNKSLTPTYIKATIYRNYGAVGQQKEVKVFRLDLKNVNQQLFRLPVNGKMGVSP